MERIHSCVNEHVLHLQLYIVGGLATIIDKNDNEIIVNLMQYNSRYIIIC